MTKEEKAAYMREYRKRRPEIVKASEAATRARNREKILVRKREYRQRNAEKIAEYNLQYQNSHPERRKVWHDSYKEKRPDVYATIKAKRRSCEKRLVSWYDPVEVAKIYRECAEVSKRTGVAHHVDHIVPLNGKYVCGLHVQGNMQVITAKENFKKSNKWGS